jgi:glycosyltransferase involved in cell wall biosynthesis
VLLVSTIEIRKNHALMFRIWRRLLRDLPAESVPTLVFAGKVGWLTADLMQQLENCDWLDGRIRFVASPSDAELARLYRGCLFTVFPSLYEGWGLPVTESLAFGKTVAASDRASIPEAGGPFCAYYDPENTGDAYAVIRRLIERTEEVAALEAKIIAEYRPPVWADSARRLYDTLVAAPPPPLPLSLDLPVDAA